MTIGRVSVILFCGLLLCVGCPRAHVESPAPGSDIRIVSLAPSLTEIICAVGGGDLLVGRTSACDYPPDVVGKVPVVGDFGVPSLEILASVRPTIVLDVDLSDETTAVRIENLGLARKRIKCHELKDIAPAIREIGMICGRRDRAEALARRIESGIARWRREADASEGRPSVYAEIWHDPLTTVGRGAFLSELIQLAGGRNIGDAVAGGYFQMSPEHVLAENPNVILCLYMTGGGYGAQAVGARPGWGEVDAVRREAVFDDLNNDIILRPGPRVLEGIQALRTCMESK